MMWVLGMLKFLFSNLISACFHSSISFPSSLVHYLNRHM